MRTQVTVYVGKELKSWLARYAKKSQLRESEVIRILLERERHFEWLPWAISEARRKTNQQRFLVSDPPQKPRSKRRFKAARSGK